METQILIIIFGDSSAKQILPRLQRGIKDLGSNFISRRLLKALKNFFEAPCL